jgi:hypothetical protein
VTGLPEHSFLDVQAYLARRPEFGDVTLAPEGPNALVVKGPPDQAHQFGQEVVDMFDSVSETRVALTPATNRGSTPLVSYTSAAAALPDYGDVRVPEGWSGDEASLAPMMEHFRKVLEGITRNPVRALGTSVGPDASGTVHAEFVYHGIQPTEPGGNPHLSIWLRPAQSTPGGRMLMAGIKVQRGDGKEGEFISFLGGTDALRSRFWAAFNTAKP